MTSGAKQRELLIAGINAMAPTEFAHFTGKNALRIMGALEICRIVSNAAEQSLLRQRRGYRTTGAGMNSWGG